MREIGNRIIKQMKKGDYRAFRKLVDHYHQPVYQICYMIMGDNKSAEVLAKDTFLQVFNQRDNCLATNKKFSLWLFQQTIHLAQNRLNEQKQSEMIVCPTFNEAITSLLMHISLKERLALSLKSSNQLSIEEISEVLEIPNSDTVTYIWQGREMIRELICN